MDFYKMGILNFVAKLYYRTELFCIVQGKLQLSKLPRSRFRLGRVLDTPLCSSD